MRRPKKMKNKRVSSNLSTDLNTVKFNSILIIDNEEMDLFIAKKTLMMNNFADTIYTETSGRSALHFLENTKQVPDLILLDYLMFEMNGLEFIKVFNTLPIHITSKCKIVLLSAYVKFYEDDMIKIANEDNVVGILSKPLAIGALTEILKKSSEGI